MASSIGQKLAESKQQQISAGTSLSANLDKVESAARASGNTQMVDEVASAQSLVSKTGHKKSYFIKKALETYCEDKKDYLRAVDVLHDIEAGHETVSDWEDVKKRLGL